MLWQGHIPTQREQGALYLFYFFKIKKKRRHAFCASDASVEVFLKDRGVEDSCLIISSIGHILISSLHAGDDPDWRAGAQVYIEADTGEPSRCDGLGADGPSGSASRIHGWDGVSFEIVCATLFFFF
jgi:hypothetical protein